MSDIPSLFTEAQEQRIRELAREAAPEAPVPEHWLTALAFVNEFSNATYGEEREPLVTLFRILVGL